MASILDLERMHDSGDLAGGVSEIAAVRGPGAMTVTAVRTDAGRLRLIAWQLNTAGPVTRLGDSGDAAGEATSIDLARSGPNYVAACRDGGGKLKLISWTIDATGSSIQRQGDSGGQAGEATQIKIAAMSDTLYVVACRTGSGILRLISWRLNADGSLTRLADSGDLAGGVSEISLTRLAVDRVVTSVRDGDGDLKLITWSVTPAGAIARLGDSGDQAGDATLIRSGAIGTGMVATSVRTGDGKLRVITWQISATGQVTRAGDSGDQAGDIGDNSLISLPDGVVTGVRTAEGNLRLIAWRIDADGSLTRRGDSASQAGASSRIDLLPGPGTPDANGHSVTMVAAVRTGAGNLRLITWGPAVVRLHFKVLTTPTVSTATMLTSMQTVYATVGIRVVLASTENLTLPLLNDLDVGTCTLGNTTTEQQQLCANRNNVSGQDVAVYFVRSTIPPLNGCAAHPPGRPSVAVAQGATRWTLAHEVGHVLGLTHVGDLDRLMTDGGTGNITNPPPDLVASEQSTMIQSSFTVPV